MERELKAEELRVRRMEAERALRDAKKPWWRQPDPLLVGILAGALTLIGNIVSENLKSQHELEVERTKARYSLVLQAMATADRVAAVNNIDFFIQSGLLEDEDHKIRNAAAKLRPVLPAAGGASPVTEASTTALALAKSYGMSQELDGSASSSWAAALIQRTCSSTPRRSAARRPRWLRSRCLAPRASRIRARTSRSRAISRSSGRWRRPLSSMSISPRIPPPACARRSSAPSRTM
jgi:hypothetical protein